MARFLHANDWKWPNWEALTFNSAHCLIIAHSRRKKKVVREWKEKKKALQSKHHHPSTSHTNDRYKMADEVNTTHCRFYENKYPEIDDVVIVNIKEVRFFFPSVDVEKISVREREILYWRIVVIIWLTLWLLDCWYGSLWYERSHVFCIER